MNFPRAAVAITSALVLLAGGLALIHALGAPMKTGALWGLALALVAVAAFVVFGRYLGRIAVRGDSQQADRLAAGFAAIAERTGLRVQQEAPQDHPLAGEVTSPPALIGLYRGWWVRVQLNVAGDQLDQFEILIPARKGTRWPKLGRISESVEMSVPARAAAERLRSRTRGPDRVRSITVSPTTMRAVTREMVTDGPGGSLVGGTLLEGVLDDLVLLAEGLPVAAGMSVP